MTEKAHVYQKDYAKFTDSNWDKIFFPQPQLRAVFQGVRTPTLIPGRKAIVDTETDHTYEIVSDAYKLIAHEEVLHAAEEIIKAFPEWGTPTRTLEMNNYGGRIKITYTFTEVDFEIRPGDVVHPTLDVYASFDTSWAYRICLGGHRVICSNGMKISKILAEYKKKHTDSLDIGKAQVVIRSAMEDYSQAAELWQSYVDRLATPEECFIYENLRFQKKEKLAIESRMHQLGLIKKWDDDDRDVEINAWEMYNILTEEASHNVTDLARRTSILDGIAKTFVRRKLR